MVSKILGLRILAMVLVFVITIISCNSSKVDSSLNGTWVATIDGIDIEFKFRNGNYENVQSKGTYTTENNKITFNCTHVNGEGFNEYMLDMGIDFDWGLKSSWYTINEFILAVKPVFLEFGVSERDVNELVAQMVTPMPSMNYSVDNKSLILTMEGEAEAVIFLKK